MLFDDWPREHYLSIADYSGLKSMKSNQSIQVLFYHNWITKYHMQDHVGFEITEEKCSCEKQK